MPRFGAESRDSLRAGEVTAVGPPPDDAELLFIGRIRTPWTARELCPRQGADDGPECRIELFSPWDKAVSGLEEHDRIEVLYWLDRARRDLVVQNPGGDGPLYGTFALRSPVRPNPIGTAEPLLLGIEGPILRVRGLDCLDGTPLLDLKPARASFTPKARAKPGVSD